MATITERFGFTKPAGSDPASIVPLNSNTDLIEQYLGRTQDMIAPLYDDTATYEVDDIVTYESRLYKCITAISTAETFDPTKWEATTAVEEGSGGGGGSSVIPNPTGTPTDTLSTIGIDGTIYGIEGGGTSEGEGVEIYSQDEYIVGKWIDGKKLYQKTFYYTHNDTIGDGYTTIASLSDADYFEFVECSLYNPTDKRSYALSYAYGSNTTALTYDNGDIKLRINNDTWNANWDVVVTVRYTKTVETPAPAWGGSVTNNYANFIDTDNIIDSGSYQGSFTYTATEDCFITIAVVMDANNSATITIDGAVVTSGWCASLNTINPTLPLKKGQTLVATSSTSNTSDYTVYGITYASGGSETPATDASEVEYDNTTSQLTADNVQDAIDEVVANVDTASEDILTLQNVQGYDAYDETQTYAVGDYAIYNNHVYECTTAVSTAEPFDSSKWSQTSIEQIIDGVNGDVSQLNSSKLNKSGGTITGSLSIVNNLDVKGYTLSDLNGYRKIPVVTAAGVLEIGKYIDMHSTAEDTSDYTFRLNNDTQGHLIATGTIAQGSSRKIKENIEEFTAEEALKILQLNPIKFDYIKGSKNERGFIAEEVAEILPNLVTDEEGIEGTKEYIPASLNYIGLIPYLIKVVQLQQKQIDKLLDVTNS